MKPSPADPNSFPRLAFACPKLWTEMSGDERTRFCSTCGLHVHNLSVLTADERASLRRNTQGRLCVTYQRRLNGAYVTPDQPLTAREKSNLRQVGAVALSAAALALATGCVSQPESVIPSLPPVVATPSSATPPPATTPAPPGASAASADDEEVIVLSGFFIEATEGAAGYEAVQTLAGARIKP